MLRWLLGPRRSDVKLVQSILHAETERAKLRASKEERENALELRKMELEMANLEVLGEERRKDRADREKLRQDRQQWAAKAREARAAKKNLAVSGVQGTVDAAACPVCRNPGDPHLTANDIKWHHNGHRAAG